MDIMKSGSMLPNTATVLAIREGYGDSRIAICRFRDQLVTWVIDRENAAHWGRYFGDDIIAAMESYTSR